MLPGNLVLFLFFGSNYKILLSSWKMDRTNSMSNFFFPPKKFLFKNINCSSLNNSPVRNTHQLKPRREMGFQNLR